MSVLFLIPARAGSRGLPGKNTKMLGDKPLVAYSIDFALSNLKPGDELCVSTNDAEVINVANARGVKVPFVRPDNLATDTASSYDVIMHALEFYEKEGKFFDWLLLLQPTSPFRVQKDIIQLFEAIEYEVEMVVTVKKVKENPYFSLFEENTEGFLVKSKQGDYHRRQDCPEVFAYNGSMYLIKVSALKNNPINRLNKIKKVVLPLSRSIDIDTMEDWILAEYYLKLQ
jgi:CMP-N,N'-diacetyllegionaminic acid synthase